MNDETWIATWKKLLLLDYFHIEQDWCYIFFLLSIKPIKRQKPSQYILTFLLCCTQLHIPTETRHGFLEGFKSVSFLGHWSFFFVFFSHSNNSKKHISTGTTFSCGSILLQPRGANSLLVTGNIQKRHHTRVCKFAKKKIFFCFVINNQNSGSGSGKSQPAMQRTSLPKLSKKTNPSNN